MLVGLWELGSRAYWAGEFIRMFIYICGVKCWSEGSAWICVQGLGLSSSSAYHKVFFSAIIS